MASKVLVKLPSMPFSQERRAPSEIMPLTERPLKEGSNQIKQQASSMERIGQLEQNMKFLQEEHHATLLALHQEVENLREKNRDLQFQLVFSKEGTRGASTPSSPEDSGNGFAKTKGSPVCVNFTPLQVELLEKELQDTKASLREAKTQNNYLSEIIERQKKKLDSTEEEKSKSLRVDVGVQATPRVVADGANTLEWLAETMVKRLRRENKEQKKEVTMSLSSSSSSSSSSTSTLNGSEAANRAGRSRDNVNGQQSRGSAVNNSQEHASNKFPPLQTQSYWHRRTPRNGKSRQNEKQEHPPETNPTVLPQLQNGNAKNDTATFEPAFYRSRGYRNHYREDNFCKCRGQTSQRDRRDNDHYSHRREYKDKTRKIMKREFVETADGSRSAENSTGTKS